MRICLLAKPDAPQTRRMVAGLVERGAEVHVVYRGSGEVPGATYTPYAIPPRSLRNPLGWSRRKRDYLARCLRDFDVVSVQFLHSWGFTEEMMAERGFCVRPWGSDIHPPPGGPQPRAETIERRKAMLRCAASVAVTCETFRDEVARFASIDATRIERIPLGVDLSRFTPQEPPRGERIVGFFKGFGHAYGAEHLIRAMPRIASADSAVRFEMIGDGPTLPTCRALAAELGVDRLIRWTPRLAHADIPKAIGRWCLSVIPSVRESFGVAALESSAVGLPVVASRVGGLCETVADGETGVLVEPESSDAIAGAVINLLQDEEKRIAMGAAGRRFVEEHYDERDCHDRWYAYFERIADRCLQPA